MCANTEHSGRYIWVKNKLLKARAAVGNANFPSSGFQRASLPRFMLPLLPVSGLRIKLIKANPLWREGLEGRVLKQPVAGVLRKQEAWARCSQLTGCGFVLYL